LTGRKKKGDPMGWIAPKNLAGVEPPLQGDVSGFERSSKKSACSFDAASNKVARRL
jgi:hypothetical protein